jgi:hypothetical protein
MPSKLLIRSVAVLALGAAALPLNAYAQGRGGDRDRDQGSQLNRVIDDIKDALQEAERRRDPDRQLIGDLRRILRRYDSPWQNMVIEDDFRDGDLRRNPPWDIVAGQFMVDRQYGLRTQQQFRRQQQGGPGGGGDLGNRLLGAVLDQAVRPQGGPPSDRAEAYVQGRITNSFSVSLALNSRSRDGGRIEFVLFEGRDRRDGYRLAYSPEGQSNLEIVRVNNGRAQTVESTRQRVDLEDGRDHRIVWTHERDGDMKVEIDGREVLSTRERGSNDFDGFGIVNYGGDYGVRQVQIAGTDRR